MNDKRFPWISLILIVVCSFSFEYNTATSAFNYDGMSVAMIALAILSIVFTFKITGKAQDVLLAHNLIEQKVSSSYEKLLPFVILIPAIGYTAVSDNVFEGIKDEIVFSWRFDWGQSELHIWAILLFLLFLFLHRVVLILQEMERSSAVRNE